MPDMRVSVKPTAGVGKPSRASVGGTTPAVLRPSSVGAAVQPVGSAGAVSAVGAGVRSVASVPVAAVTVAAAGAFDPDELDKMQQRQFTGGRPSGIGEAVNNLRDMYAKKERDAAEDARALTRAALAAQEAVIRKYNEVAAATGLPTVELPSDAFAEIIDNEGRSIGDASGLGGAQVGSEVMPAWRSDP